MDSRVYSCVAVFALAVAVPVTGAAIQPSAPAASLVAVLRLDGHAEDFSAIETSSIKVGPRGTIAVWEPQDFRLKFYDSTGKRLSTVGRQGGGPGEFGSSRCVTGWVHDTLWIYDPSQRRFSFVSPTGQFLRSQPLPVATPDPSTDQTALTVLNFSPTAIVPGGDVLGVVHVRVRRDGQQRAVAQHALMSMGGKLVKTMGAPPSTDGMFVDVPRATPPDARGAVGSAASSASVPFFPAPLRAVAPSGAYFGSLVTNVSSAKGGTLNLVVQSSEGDTVVSRAYAFTGAAIPSDAVDGALESIRDPDLRALVRSRVPGVYPPAVRLALGADGSTWIQLRGTGVGEPVVLLDARGDGVASAMLPRGTQLVQGSRNSVWVLERNADGVASVVRYRITGAR